MGTSASRCKSTDSASVDPRSLSASGCGQRTFGPDRADRRPTIQPERSNAIRREGPDLVKWGLVGCDRPEPQISGDGQATDANSRHNATKRPDFGCEDQRPVW